jgi:anti-sigma factor RsiW
MVDKPTFEQILDWVEGRLQPADAERVAHLVESDSELRASADWARAFVRRSSASRLEAAPDNARAAVFKLIATRRKPQPSAVQRMVAALLPNSRPRLAVRGSQRAAQRQLTFSAELADVVVNIQPHAHQKQSNIQGQVLVTGTLDANRLVVQMLRGGAEFGITMTNALGEFGFESIPPGSYELIISSDLAEIELSPITLSD